MRLIYSVLAIGLILMLAFFSLNYWEVYYPLYLEIYDVSYHVAASVGMDRAGGLTMTSFWQYASRQDPMYYPPFFQLLGFLLLRLGVDINFLAKYITWMLYPMALFTLWFFMRQCFGGRIGFYSLMLYSLPPLLMNKLWGHPPFGLVCVLMPLVFLSLFKRRYIAALILTLSSLATHMSAGIILLVLLIYGLHARGDRKPVFMILAALALLGIPFFWIAMKRVAFFEIFSFAGMGQFLNSVVRGQGMASFFDYKTQHYVYLGILGGLGAVVCYFRKDRFLLFPGLFIALFLAKNIAGAGGAQGQFRYIQMLAMVFLPMLGGIFLDAMHGRLERVRFLRRRVVRAEGAKSLSRPPARFLTVKSFAILVLVIILAHALFYSLSERPRYDRAPTAIFLNWPEIWVPYKLLFTMEQRERLLQLIEKHVAEDEMIYNSAGANLGSSLSAFSRRSLTRDIGAWPKMLVVEKPVSGYRFLEEMNPRFSVYILEDKERAGKVTVPRPLVAVRQIQWVFVALGVLVLADLLGISSGKQQTSYLGTPYF